MSIDEDYEGYKAIWEDFDDDISEEEVIEE